ncbi:MAG: response regulator [Sphingobium sp.]|nr:response regulator [Sphingobium sp.]
MLRPDKMLVGTLLAALIVPFIIFLIFALGFSWREQRRDVQVSTQERAEQSATEIATHLEAVSYGLTLSATAESVMEGRWPQARYRTGQIARLSGNWRNLIIQDSATGAILVNLHNRPLPARPASTLGLAPNTVVFSDIERLQSGQPALFARILSREGPRALLLTAELDPAPIQKIVLKFATAEGVNAVVDGRGLFVARTRDWPARFGTPATQYVRNAISKSRSGIYEGVTYEGLKNYTAFKMIDGMGWSAHVAVSNELFDRPQRQWLYSVVIAGIISVCLALLVAAATFRMIQARRIMEEKSRHAERLESIGRLTGGIAHDFNNMLAVILGNVDLAQRKLAKGNPDIGDFLSGAEQGVLKAKALTHRLLAFASKQKLESRFIDVNALVAGMEMLLKRTLGSTISIEVKLAKESWLVQSDTGELENAILNLAVNARDAMPTGGTLIIAVENVSKGARLAMMSRPHESDCVAISVTDTGTGMSPQVAARALDPFFTTKEIGKGTGLGLSQIHGFVSQSNGRIWIDSDEGVGTTVMLLLPRAMGDADRVEEPAPAVADHTPDQTILVIEDETELLGMLTSELSEAGYNVMQAKDGEKALRLLRRHRRIDLVITDMNIPHMDGVTFAAQAHAMRPGLKILFMSAINRDDIPQDTLLCKPFTMAEMEAALRRLLAPKLVQQG